MTYISRRSLIASAATLALPRALHAQSAQFDADVLIVGAGAAGLAAAHECVKLKRSYILVEARARIGGRVFTDTSLGVPFDAGALYIHWGETNPWREVAQQLGVETVDDRKSQAPFQLYENGTLIGPAERMKRRAAFGALAGIFDGDAAQVGDVSMAATAATFGPDVGMATAAMARMSLGEEPEHVSAQDYARLWSGEDLLVPSGYGALVERYGADLKVSLDTVVSEIRWGGVGVEAVTNKGSVRARKAIVTVPVGVLKAGAIKFIPALPVVSLEGINGLGMGALSKIALKFDGTRFGIPVGSDVFEIENGLTFDFECWPFDRNIVVAYVGGDHARSVTGQGERGAIETVFNAFTKVAGVDARKAFVAGRMAAWTDDPLSLGCYSHALPGQANARAKLLLPVADKIWFAGEATGGTDFGGAMTAGGAFLAGRDAVHAVFGQ